MVIALGATLALSKIPSTVNPCTSSEVGPITTGLSNASVSVVALILADFSGGGVVSCAAAVPAPGSRARARASVGCHGRARRANPSRVVL